VGEINFYGLHKVTAEQLLTALNLKSGDPLPPSKTDLEDRLTDVEGVLDAHVEAVCCEGPKATLFIGIEEQDGPHFNTRNAPAGDGVLPDTLLGQYRDYVASMTRAAASGGAADPDARRLEDAFAAYAADNLPLLRDVLRSGSESDQRAVAATVIGYAPNKADVVNDLQYALQDPEDSVRANAARSLKSIAVFAERNPASDIKVMPLGLVAMLNSIVLSDRLQAAQALVVLTSHPNPEALGLMQEGALSSLIEMARWKMSDYAQPAFLLLGRIGGIPDSDLQAQWQNGDRETVIAKAAASGARTGR